MLPVRSFAEATTKLIGPNCTKKILLCASGSATVAVCFGLNSICKGSAQLNQLHHTLYFISSPSRCVALFHAFDIPNHLSLDHLGVGVFPRANAYLRVHPAIGCQSAGTADVVSELRDWYVFSAVRTVF